MTRNQGRKSEIRLKFFRQILLFRIPMEWTPIQLRPSCAAAREPRDSSGITEYAVRVIRGGDRISRKGYSGGTGWFCFVHRYLLLLCLFQFVVGEGRRVPVVRAFLCFRGGPLGLFLSSFMDSQNLGKSIISGCAGSEDLPV
jgi:hypothetical protein